MFANKSAKPRSRKERAPELRKNFFSSYNNGTLIQNGSIRPDARESAFAQPEFNALRIGVVEMIAAGHDPVPKSIEEYQVKALIVRMIASLFICFIRHSHKR
jgi:hypothetical protein